ncbi:MAG TPA: cysteine desulfurase family protein [Actinomycetota bacterium]|nr:cysteine desulfurase family protein [Actinomycetota bacterium]
MHYLDHAATTPVLPEVRDTMLPFLEDDFGNPSSVHGPGRRAKEAVEDARDRVANAIGASPAEVVFTGGGTDADNLAVKGAAHKLRGNGNHIVTTSFEHHGVLGPAEWLEGQGFEVTTVSVRSSGVVDPQEIAAATRKSTVLVSVMTVNNEIGTIQPIAEIVETVKASHPNALVHTDAVQALGNIAVDVDRWGVDLASFSAHKVGGPKGVGALFVRSGTALEPVTHGGGQERGLRSGTLNVPGIAGLGVAAQVAAKEVDEKQERVRKMRDALLAGLREAVPDLIVNGELEHRVAGNLNVCIPRAEGQIMLLLLDQAGIACSSGSACQSGAVDPSHVLLAIGVSPALAKGSLRFSFGRASDPSDVQAVLEVFEGIVAQARKVAA